MYFVYLKALIGVHGLVGAAFRARRKLRAVVRTKTGARMF